MALHAVFHSLLLLTVGPTALVCAALLVHLPRAPTQSLRATVRGLGRDDNATKNINTTVRFSEVPSSLCPDMWCPRRSHLAGGTLSRGDWGNYEVFVTAGPAGLVWQHTANNVQASLSHGSSRAARRGHSAIVLVLVSWRTPMPFLCELLL